MINNIKQLYNQVEVKNEAIQAVADATGVRANTVKAHWLSNSGLWSVPKMHQAKVVEVLQNVINNQ